jgi:hypothetical protein
MKKNILSALLIFTLISVSAQKNIFEETFKNNKNKWILSSKITKDSATLLVAKSELIIDNKQQAESKTLINIPNNKINLLNDEEFTISIDAAHLNGNNRTIYGLLFGETLQDEKFNGYGFFLVDTGYYKINFVYNGKVTTKKDYTASSAIKINNAQNKITVIKKRNILYFLINHQLVHHFTIYDAKISSVGALATNKQKVAFSNLKIESFAKEKDKKEQDKINDLTTIVNQSQNNFINAYELNNNEHIKNTWLPFINEQNKNQNILFSGYPNCKYEDNWSYDKLMADAKFKEYSKYIEKVLGQFEKIEKPTVLGKKTYWTSKNPKHTLGTYILIDEYDIDKNYFIKLVVCADKEMTKENIEKMKD